jgi:hypothetical protein
MLACPPTTCPPLGNGAWANAMVLNTNVPNAIPPDPLFIIAQSPDSFL